MQSIKELSSSIQASSGECSETKCEFDIYHIIQQALVENIQSAFLSGLKPKEKTKLAKRYHDVAETLSTSNQSIIEFKKQLFDFISDMIDLLDSDKRTIIKSHIKKIARKLVIKIKSLATNQFDEKLIHTIDLHEVLVLPSVSIENDKSSFQADDRVLFSEERKQRRYDSLARLLSMSSEMSVCTAITIFNDKLIISSNCSRPDWSENIVKTILAKLNIVRQAIEQVSRCRDLAASYQFHQHQVNLLRLNGGLFQPENILIQALSKLIQSTLIVEETPSAPDNFSPEEVNALLVSDNVTCLMPYEEAGENNFIYGIAIYDCHDGSLRKNQFPFSTHYPSADISHFHAEQLIAFYLRTIKKLTLVDVSEDAPIFYLGVSKLCCVTCSVLTNFSQLKLRGSSGDLFQNTINLFADEFSPTIKPPCSPDLKLAKKRKAYAEESPFSPNDPLATDKKRILGTDFGKTATSLFSSNSRFHTATLSISPTALSTFNSEFVSQKHL